MPSAKAGKLIDPVSRLDPKQFRCILAGDEPWTGAGRGGKERARMPGYRYFGRATPADPSAVAARRAATSVPAPDKVRQDPRKFMENHELLTFNKRVIK